MLCQRVMLVDNRDWSQELAAAHKVREKSISFLILSFLRVRYLFPSFAFARRPRLSMNERHDTKFVVYETKRKPEAVGELIAHDRLSSVIIIYGVGLKILTVPTSRNGEKNSVKIPGSYLDCDAYQYQNRMLSLPMRHRTPQKIHMNFTDDFLNYQQMSKICRKNFPVPQCIGKNSV